MDRKGIRTATAHRACARPFGWPLVASTLVHAAALGTVLWWAAARAPGTPAERIGSARLRPVAEERATVAELELLESILLDEAADPVEPPDLAAEPPADEFEPLFEIDDDLHLVEPLSFTEVPLSAAREPRPQPAPRPAPAPAAPAPPPLPPVVRPHVVHTTPAPRMPRPVPRVAPSPARRTPLRVVRAPDPRHFYPPDALRRRLGGRTLVRLTIDARGYVVSAHVEQTSGSRLLDRAAVSLAYAYRFNTGRGLRSTRLPVTFRPPGYGSGL